MLKVLLCHREHVARVGEEHIATVAVLSHILILALLELVEFFGIVAETGNPDDGAPVPSEVASPATAVQRPEVEAFVHQVAGLSLWSYDRDDGTPYRECEPPSDGFLDSHCCLMDLIEEARRLREGR